MELFYQPKNSTHHFLRIGSGVLALFLVAVLIFNQQIRSGFPELSKGLQSSKCFTFNSTETIFSEHYEYQNWSQAADPLWEQLIPANGGFIVDESNPENSVYGLAMFHQLHCVQMIRNAFQELYARLDGRSDGGGNVLHDLDEGHLLHCLDYFRQVFLCYADGAIEPTRPDQNNRGRLKTDGMVPHHCRNPDVWYEKARASRQSDGPPIRELHSHDHHNHV